jgi:hypothetical protein
MGIFQNGIFQKESFRKYFQQNQNLSEWNLLDGIFQKQLFKPTGIFQKELFRMESFRIFSAKPESFRMESFRIIFFAKPESCRTESFRMESCRRNLSENILSKTRIFHNGIFQKESFIFFFE